MQLQGGFPLITKQAVSSPLGTAKMEFLSESIVVYASIPIVSAKATSACSKQASGARTMPAPT